MYIITETFINMENIYLFRDGLATNSSGSQVPVIIFLLVYLFNT